MAVDTFEPESGDTDEDDAHEVEDEEHKAPEAVDRHPGSRRAQKRDV